MKHLLLFTAMVLLASCGGPQNTPMTIEQIAADKFYTVGKLDKIYRCTTAKPRPDGSYLVANFQSIKKYKSFITPTNEGLTNVIVIKNGIDIEGCSYFVRNVGFVGLFDEFGNEYYDFESSIVESPDGYCDIILQSKDDVDKYKYIQIGEFDRSLYDSSILLFHIE